MSERRTVNRQNFIYKLDPVLEDRRLMEGGRQTRVCGRLSKGAMPLEVKHPLNPSKEQHVSMLILKDFHQRLGHSGQNHNLSAVRRKYWIKSAQSAIRKVISKCSFLRCYNGKAMVQKMADLPKERIIPDLPPFTHVGVDFFGPVEVKRGRSICKRYGVISTCLASRAVHSEVSKTETDETDACINALHWFISRRGQVVHIRPDNGTNFVDTERELREVLIT